MCKTMDTLVETIKQSFFNQSFFSEGIVDSEVIDILIKYQTNYRKLQKRLLQLNVEGVSNVICKTVSQVIKTQDSENKETVEELREKNSRLARKNKSLQLQNDNLVQANQILGTNKPDLSILDTLTQANKTLEIENAGILVENDAVTQANRVLEAEKAGILAENDTLIRDLVNDRKLLRQSNDELVKANEVLGNDKMILQGQNDRLQGQNDQLQQQIDGLQQSNSILISQIAAADQMKASLQSENEILQQRITDLEKELSKPVSIAPNITVPLQIVGI